MIPFKDWLEIREASASSRRKLQAALGLAPPVADIFSRSTPPPWQVERLEKALKKSHKKKKKKKKKVIEEAKKKQVIVHNDIDAFIKSVELLAKDIWKLDFLKKKKAAEEKMDQIAKRHTGITQKNKEEKIDDPKSSEEEEKEKDEPIPKSKPKPKPMPKSKPTKAVNPPKKDI